MFNIFFNFMLVLIYISTSFIQFVLKQRLCGLRYVIQTLIIFLIQGLGLTRYEVFRCVITIHLFVRRYRSKENNDDRYPDFCLILGKDEHCLSLICDRTRKDVYKRQVVCVHGGHTDGSVCVPASSNVWITSVTRETLDIYS